MLMRNGRSILRNSVLALAASGFAISTAVFIFLILDDQSDLTRSPPPLTVRAFGKAIAFADNEAVEPTTPAEPKLREAMPWPCRLAMSDRDAVSYYESVIAEILAEVHPRPRSWNEEDKDERSLQEAAKELKQRGSAAASAIPVL